MARFGTRAIHGVEMPAPSERPLTTPIWQSSSFAFDDAERFAAALHDPREGYAYSRYGNPTTAALEGLMADLEGGSEAMAAASGMGAIASVLLGLAVGGDHLLLQREVYGGTFSLATAVARRFGIDTSFVDATDPIAVKEAMRPETRALYVETIANPTMTVADLPAMAEVALQAGVPLVVDNTIATPFFCRPIEHGASVVLHSATKYIGGHSDVVAGLAVFADKELHRRSWKTMLDIGASIDPFAAWLLLRGLKTLPVRMERHVANAAAVAELLAGHPKVERVYWPGLPEHPTHAVAERVLDGFGGMLSFDLSGGRAADLTPEMLATARRYGRHADAALVLGTRAACRFAMAAIDAVFAAGLLPHLPRPVEGLAELARVVRPGGVLGIFHPSSRVAQAARHGRSVRDDDLLARPTLRRLFEATGWSFENYDDSPDRFLAIATRTREGASAK